MAEEQHDQVNEKMLARDLMLRASGYCEATSPQSLVGDLARMMNKFFDEREALNESLTERVRALIHLEREVGRLNGVIAEGEEKLKTFEDLKINAELISKSELDLRARHSEASSDYQTMVQEHDRMLKDLDATSRYNESLVKENASLIESHRELEIQLDTERAKSKKLEADLRVAGIALTGVFDTSPEIQTVEPEPEPQPKPKSKRKPAAPVVE